MLRASLSWPYPGELHLSVASPRSAPQFIAWQIGGEVSYVASETPASPYTRYGEGVVFRLRIEKGF